MMSKDATALGDVIVNFVLRWEKKTVWNKKSPLRVIRNL